MVERSVRNWVGPPAASLAAAAGVNLAVRALGLEGGGAGPPGWVVGSVWTAIFLLYGLAYAALRRAPGGTGARRAGIVGLGLACLAYPFYTAGFEATGVALAGTLATFLAAAALVAWLWPVSRAAAVLVAPVLPWLAYAATIT